MDEEKLCASSGACGWLGSVFGPRSRGRRAGVRRRTPATPRCLRSAGFLSDPYDKPEALASESGRYTRWRFGLVGDGGRDSLAGASSLCDGSIDADPAAFLEGVHAEGPFQDGLAVLARLAVDG